MYLGMAAAMFGMTACAESSPITTPVVSESAAKSAASTASLSKVELPTLDSVKPPLKPKINHHYISEANLAKLPLPTQPQALTDVLMGLQEGPIEERKAKLKAKVLADMVYVRGGKFMMGDFAKLMGVEGVTRMTYNEDDKHTHEVTLSDFWISKYKTTYAEFDVFSDATGKTRNGMEYGGDDRHPLIPAGTYWQHAKDYCQWLGQLTGLPMDLPTEAQWEYAARSRGQYFMTGTDDGNIERGRNIPYYEQDQLLRDAYQIKGYGYPVGVFPPNPLGLYDISHNNEEWVRDWYAADAYDRKEAVDPQGPPSGQKKVMRGWGRDSLMLGANVWRRPAEPIPVRERKADGGVKLLSTVFSPAVRCAVVPH